jgi:Tol biopolymer transport system component
MVYAQGVVPPWDIWRVPGRAASPPEQAPAKLIASSGSDDSPAYSPDGRRIAFSSSRTGVENIWVCDSDGSNPIQLTSFERFAGVPAWSPDGRQLAFASPEAGDWSIYVIDAEGGVPRRLTPEPSEESTPVWSHDGQWIYFYSNRSGEFQVWKIPSEGGQAVQVTRDGGAVPAVSWDDRYLYYQKSESLSGIWRMAVDGGEETEVVRERINPWSWALGRTGLYFATNEPILKDYSEKYTIRYLDFESAHVTELYRKEGPLLHRFLAVSPNEEWVLYGEMPAPTSELMLVENFR